MRISLWPIHLVSTYLTEPMSSAWYTEGVTKTIELSYLPNSDNSPRKVYNGARFALILSNIASLRVDLFTTCVYP